MPIYGADSSPLLVGSGDPLSLFVTPPVAGQYLNFAKGTVAAPDTVPQPLGKYERSLALLNSQATSGEQSSALLAMARSVPPNEVQVSGITAIAESRSDTASIHDDVAAGVFFGTWDLTVPPLQAANSHGIEGSFHAARNTSSPLIAIAAIEAQAQQYYPRNPTALGVSAITGDGTTTTVTVTASPSRVNKNGRVSFAGTGQAWDVNAISSIVGAAGVATVTFAATHGFANGATVRVVGTVNFDGDHLITGVTATTITFASTVTTTENVGTVYYRIETISGLSGFTIKSTVNAAAAAGTATTPVGDAWNDNGSVTPWSTSFTFAAAGRYRAACAFQFNRPAGLPAFHVGMLVPAFAATGDGRGPIDYATILDDGQSDFSLRIQQAHSRAAISVPLAASGPVVLGADDLTAIGSDASGTLLAVSDAPGSSAHALAFFGTQSGAKQHYIVFSNSTGRLVFYVANAANQFLTGDATGSIGFKLTKAGKSFRMGGATGGCLFEFSEDGKIGFNNATPVTKPAVTGSRAGNAALASLLTQLSTLGLVTDSSTA